MKSVMTAAAIAMLAASGVAVAQEGGKEWDKMAVVTRAEAQAKAAALFDRLDLNHDGRLDQADRALHDQQMFDRVDTNHDGQISREEFAAARDHGPGGPGPDGVKPGDGKGGPGHWRRGRWGHGMGHGPMGMAGRGPDDVVTKDEFVGKALRRFDAADTNHDGKLTPEERKAAHKAMRDKWRQDRQHRRGGPGGNPPAPGDAPPPPPPAG